MKENQTFYLKQNSKISNFRMAKRATLELEFKPKHVEYFGDYFVIIYDQKAMSTSAAAAEEEEDSANHHNFDDGKGYSNNHEAGAADFSAGKRHEGDSHAAPLLKVPYIDIFEKTGKPISRVDLSEILL